jgi:hypothetical protein
MASPFGKFWRWAMMRHSTISDSPSSRPGMTPAMNRCATDTVPPAASE